MLDTKPMWKYLSDAKYINKNLIARCKAMLTREFEMEDIGD
jgi:hypothetical protein